MERKKAPYSVINVTDIEITLRKPCQCTRIYNQHDKTSRMVIYCMEHGMVYSELNGDRKQLFDEFDHMLVNIALNDK